MTSVSRALPASAKAKVFIFGRHSKRFCKLKDYKASALLSPAAARILRNSSGLDCHFRKGIFLVAEKSKVVLEVMWRLTQMTCSVCVHYI